MKTKPEDGRSEDTGLLEAFFGHHSAHTWKDQPEYPQIMGELLDYLRKVARNKLSLHPSLHRDANDIAQNVVLKLLLTVEAEPAKIQGKTIMAYIYTMLMNEIVDRFRQQSRSPASLLEDLDIKDGRPPQDLPEDSMEALLRIISILQGVNATLQSRDAQDLAADLAATLSPPSKVLYLYRWMKDENHGKEVEALFQTWLNGSDFLMRQLLDELFAKAVTRKERGEMAKAITTYLKPSDTGSDVRYPAGRTGFYDEFRQALGDQELTTCLPEILKLLPQEHPLATRTVQNPPALNTSTLDTFRDWCEAVRKGGSESLAGEALSWMKDAASKLESQALERIGATARKQKQRQGERLEEAIKKALETAMKKGLIPADDEEMAQRWLEKLGAGTSPSNGRGR